MATEKSSAEDAKTLSDSKDSAPEGSDASAAKSKGVKPSVDEWSYPVSVDSFGLGC